MILPILLIMVLLVSACSPAGSSHTGYAKSDVSRDTNPEVSPEKVQALVNGNTAFAFDFYRQISSGEGNLIYSPLSLSLALGMTLSGARGETRAEMLQALSLQALGDDLHSAFNALLLAIEASEAAEVEDQNGEKFQLNIANSIWKQVGEHFEQAFLEGLALNYGAGMYQVDFANQTNAARQAINNWVSGETKGKIPELVPENVISSLTSLVLANAIYFKGSWASPFLDGGTRPAPFTLLDGSAVEADMMVLPTGHVGFTQGEDFLVFSLPYLSRDFAMLLFLPDEGKFAAVEQNLDVESLQEVLQSLEERTLNLYMPKFDFATPIDAVPPLQALGMISAFGPADFSGMTGSKELFISDVVHKATITLDEKGTEAAAATAVMMAKSMSMSYSIDRPFLFTIVHQPTGSILFMGRVLEP